MAVEDEGPRAHSQPSWSSDAYFSFRPECRKSKPCNARSVHATGVGGTQVPLTHQPASIRPPPPPPSFPSGLCISSASLPVRVSQRPSTTSPRLAHKQSNAPAHQESSKACNLRRQQSNQATMWVTSMPQVWDEEARSGGGSKGGAAGGMVTPAPATALLGSLAGWLSRVADPPAPKVCGSPGGPPVTAPRVTLRDGRHLAYCESGVPKDEAKFKVVFSHGFTGSREDSVRATQEVAEELGVYMVGFDRAGYGESDPNPNRSVKSAALDVEELADALGLGPKFYVIGISLGCHAVWGALKYIPERIAGAAMMAPVVNHWWPGFPADLAAEVYNKQEVGDQWALRVSHHAPGILHWWMDQSWLPTSTVVAGTTPLPNKRDADIRTKLKADGTFQQKKELATQQGIHESYYRDMMVMFGKWEFDPMSLPKPPCPVHIWQGDEDGLVPVVLQRYIASRLSWVNYHELSETGHFLSPVPGLGDTVLRTLFS